MRKLIKLLLLVPSASVFFISCKEEELQPARLMVANMVINPPVSPSPLPTAGTAVDIRWGGDLVLNNVVYGAASVTTGNPVTTVSTPAIIISNYAEVKHGAYPLNFAVAGSAGLTVYNRITSLLPDRSYTAVIFDFNPFYKTVIMEDDLSAPPLGKARIRFVQTIPAAILAASPKKDTIDVIATGGNLPPNTAIFSRRWFADTYTNSNNQQYALIDSGRYTISLRINGTPGTSSATGLLGLSFPNIRFEDGKSYTIIARLHITATAAPVPTATFITHN